MIFENNNNCTEFEHKSVPSMILGAVSKVEWLLQKYFEDSQIYSGLYQQSIEQIEKLKTSIFMLDEQRKKISERKVF